MRPEGRCLVLTGKTGRGKTHLAIAIAYRAIQNGFDAPFTIAAAVVEELSVAARDWGRVLHDPDLAQAIADRVLEHGRLVQLDGPSMRTRHLGLDEDPSHEAPSPPSRISEIATADFPEPTEGDATKGGINRSRWSRWSPDLSSHF